jgi:PKD repeat protein
VASCEVTAGRSIGFLVEQSTGTLTNCHFENNVKALHIGNSSVDLTDTDMQDNEHGLAAHASTVTVYGGTCAYNVIALSIAGEESTLDHVLFHHNTKAVELAGDNNTVTRCSFWKNLYGVYAHAAGNVIYHNNFVGNVEHARDFGANVWNMTYPSGGNYWADYAGQDFLSGPAQNITGGDGIGDIPYELYENEDFYPFMVPHANASPIPNEPPLARFYYYPMAASSFEIVAFVDTSFDENGADDIIAWSWDFDDGNTSDEQNPRHAFKNHGTFNVSLTVEDAAGNRSSTVLSITIANLPPVAAFSWGAEAVKTRISFNASGSYDRDGTLRSYAWDFDDGSVATGVSPSHTYAFSGTYDVTLTVTDDFGATDELMQKVTVENTPPAAWFVADKTSVKAGETVTFTDRSEDSDGDIVEWRWGFGDGTYASEPNATHTFDTEGTYNVTLYVKDNDGVSERYTMVITVTAEETPAFEAVYACMVFVAAALLLRQRRKRFK